MSAIKHLTGSCSYAVSAQVDTDTSHLLTWWLASSTFPRICVKECFTEAMQKSSTEQRQKVCATSHSK